MLFAKSRQTARQSQIYELKRPYKIDQQPIGINVLLTI